MYGLALAVGGLLRFALLGRPALDDAEAGLALQAAALAQGSDVALSAHPAYLLLTTVITFLFRASNFTARFWPALAGTVLIGAAWLLKDRIGRRAALVLAFFLAFDPGLVAISRQAGSISLAVACLGLGIAFALRRSEIGVGVFAGLSVLCGPQIWPGLIALGITAWLLRSKTQSGELRQPWLDYKKTALFAAASFILVGSLFLLVPRGFSAGGASIVEYLRGWATPAGMVSPVFRLVATLFAYELPVMVLAVIGVVRGVRLKDRLDKALGIWWVVALILALVYPAHSTLDLAWAWLPMLVLAARQVLRFGDLASEDLLPAVGQAVLAFVLIFFMVYSSINLPVGGLSGSSVQTVFYIKTGVALLLLLAVSFLVVWGWSIRVAFTGLAWALSALLVILWVSGTFHAAGLSRNPDSELLRSAPYVADADLVVQTIQQTAQWRSDPSRPVSVAVIGFESAALRWQMRGHPQTIFTNIVSSDSQPEVVITPRKDNLEFAAAYRGQELVWTKTPAWSLVAPGEWLRWLFYRELPEESLEYNRIILWVRADVFPGGGANTTNPAVEPAVPVDGPQDNQQ
jgi:hypothetical protein